MKIAKPITLIALIIAISCHSALFAQEIMIASAGGYKKPVSEIANNFEKSNHIQVTKVFGNIQMITNQAKQTEEVACIVGDKKFLKRLENTVEFTSYTKLGDGILVLAYRKGITIKDFTDISKTEIHSIFMPQDKKAIYGIAGKETLISYGLLEKVTPKLTQVSTVPQVVSYLLTEEADAGIINLTEALSNKDKIGGYIIIPKDKYKAIEIVAGVVKGFENNNSTKEFIEYLQCEDSKKTLAKYGL